MIKQCSLYDECLVKLLAFFFLNRKKLKLTWDKNFYQLVPMFASLSLVELVMEFLVQWPIVRAGAVQSEFAIILFGTRGSTRTRERDCS